MRNLARRDAREGKSALRPVRHHPSKTCIQAWSPFIFIRKHIEVVENPPQAAAKGRGVLLEGKVQPAGELGLWPLSADKIATIFGKRVSRRMHGELATVIDQIEHGHHVFRAYFKSGFLKQYQKFLTFLRNEFVSNNLADFGLRKGLDHLDAVRTTFQVITDRFAFFQAEWLNVHVDFPLLQRLAHPITIGAVRSPGLKIHEPRIIRLFEVLLHGGPQIGGWTARQIHQAVLDTFDLSEKTYRRNQLRYDLRKLKGHGLIERDGSRYAYRLSPKGAQSPSSSSSSTSACAAPRRRPLPSPAGPATPSRQPARSRLSPRRHRHPTRRRSLSHPLLPPPPPPSSLLPSSPPPPPSPPGCSLIAPRPQ